MIAAINKNNHVFTASNLDVKPGEQVAKTKFQFYTTKKFEATLHNSKGKRKEFIRKLFNFIFA